METISFTYPQAVATCITALEQYAALRPALVEKCESLRDAVGGPWQLHAKQNAVIRWTLAVTDIPSDGKYSGVGMTWYDPHSSAAFYNLQLMDSAGQPPRPNSPAFTVQNEIRFYLDNLQEPVFTLSQLLPQIEAGAPQGVDTSALTELRLHLPEFPYIPGSQPTRTAKLHSGRDITLGPARAEPPMPAELRRQAVRDERPLIDKAKLVLHRLAVEHSRRIGGDSGGTAAQGSKAQDAGGAAQPTEAPPIPSRKLKKPPVDAVAAYRIFVGIEKDQTKIAALMAAQLKRPISQGQVSRWIRRVEKWIEAGNVLPPMLATKPVAIAPDVIEMGKRQDGLTKRQRNRSKAKSYDGDDDASE